MKEPTIVLEAVVDKRLWFWHMLFGVQGSNNDPNVMKRSNVWQQVIHGDGPPTYFILCNKRYQHGYCLVDGEYYLCAAK